MQLFIYAWSAHDECIDEECNLNRICRIRAFGITKTGHTQCLLFRGFYPYFYIEVQRLQGVNYINWDWRKEKTRLIEKLHDWFPNSILGEKRFVPQIRERLYLNAHRRKYLYLKVYCSTISERYQMVKKLQNYKWSFYTTTQGKCSVKTFCHEHEAPPVLQLTSTYKWKTTGWMTFSKDAIHQTEKYPHCTEYHVTSSLVHYEEENAQVLFPKLCCMDIEVYSHEMTKMPDPEDDRDVIFQISLLFRHKDECKKVLLALGCYDQKEVGEDVTIVVYKNETDLLLGWLYWIKKESPHVIAGYNILGFDISYMMKRAKKWDIYEQFDCCGMFENRHAKERIVDWSSSAYSFQSFHFMEMEGRLFLDLLPIVRRDYKFANYKLETVAQEFLQQSKDPIGPRDIFCSYRAFIQKQPDAQKLLSIVGKYCIQDSFLVMKLIDHLHVWIGLCEMARVCCVPILVLYTQGQQIKVYSQVFQKCTRENILVNSSASMEFFHQQFEKQFTGAHVFPPVSGIYDWIIPFDFSSLYPTTIIAYNIDFSTLVTDDSVPDADCHIIEWKDGEKQHRFRFQKSPQGILPNLLCTLLEQRSKTKQELKKVLQSPELKDYAQVLEKRQLAYKVSANSMYGIMGVQKGYLPFMPGAMCTTAMGRQSIQTAAEYVKTKHGGQLIYGDTDSIYCHFPNVEKNAQTHWIWAKQIETEFTQLFPSPMKLVFEDKIYRSFLILTKKRYIAYTCGEDGILDKKMTIRGVLLARRDNCKWVRHVYEKTVRAIMEHWTLQRILTDIIIDEIMKLLRNELDVHWFVATKTVGANYKIRPLPDDKKKRMLRLKHLGISCPNNDDEYITDSSKPKPLWQQLYEERNQPAHVQLAEKMKRRGVLVRPGSRIEYVVIRHADPKANLFLKIEDPQYQQRHRDVLPLDHLYYISNLVKPLDQLLEICFQQSNLTKRILKCIESHTKLVHQLEKAPILSFQETKNNIYDYL